MDRLLPEIISLILDFLPWDKLAPYSTISRTWQMQVEARTFQFIYISRNLDRLADFHSCFGENHQNRRAALRNFSISITLPRDGRSRAEHTENQIYFRKTISSIFQSLQRCNDWPPSEHPDAPRTFFMDIRNTTNLGGHSRWYLTLDKETVSNLPLVHYFSKMYLWRNTHRGQEVLPVTSSQLSCLFPHLESLELTFNHPCAKKRLSFRKRLAEGVLSLRSVATLRRFTLEHSDINEPSNHSFRLPNLLDGEGIDVLSEAIRKLAEKGDLTHLILRHLSVSRDLFEDFRQPTQTPSSMDSGPRQNQWLSLKYFDLDLRIDSPEGKWYFTGSPGNVSPSSRMGDSDSDDNGYPYALDYDNAWQFKDLELEVDHDRTDISDGCSLSSEETDWSAIARANTRATGNPWNPDRPIHGWRDRPDEETLNPFILSLTKALSRMPSLETGHVEIWAYYHAYEPISWPNFYIDCARARFPLRRIRELDGKKEGTWGIAFNRWRACLQGQSYWEPSDEIKTAAKHFAGPLGRAAIVTGLGVYNPVPGRDEVREIDL